MARKDYTQYIPLVKELTEKRRLSIVDIARELHIARNTVSRIQHANGIAKPADPKDKRPNNCWQGERGAANRTELKRLFDLGLSNKEIAKEMGVSKVTIQQALCRQGYHRPEFRPHPHPVRSIKPVPTPLPLLPPPSPAMMALAQFDRVVRRAMKVRLGLPTDHEDHDLNTVGQFKKKG